MKSRPNQPSKGMLEPRNGHSGHDAYKHIFRFFGLQENPFNGGPDLRYLSFTRQIQEAFDALTYGIQTRQGLMLLTGEVGTGKTTLNNYLLNWLRQRQVPTSYIFNSLLNADDLFDYIAAYFGVALQSKLKDKKSALTAWLLAGYRHGKIPVLIIDEAQDLPLSVLEEIGLLLNLESSRQKLLQIVLVGQPELEQKLARPKLLQLKQRIAVRCKIGPLSSQETRRYIHQRLHVAGARDDSAFTPDALEAVHTYSCGIPRVINLLCEHALINAYADKIRPASSQIVREIAREFQLDQIRPVDTQLYFDKIRSIKTIPPPSISTLAPIRTLETEESGPAESQQNLIAPAAFGVVGEKVPVGPNRTVTPLAAVYVPIESSRGANPDAGFCRWRQIPVISQALSLAKRRWRDQRVATIQFPILLGVSSSVARWLMQPALPRHARFRHVNVQIRKEIRKGLERSLRGVKARLGT
jgi:general secretion pathway protein A